MTIKSICFTIILLAGTLIPANFLYAQQNNALNPLLSDTIKVDPSVSPITIHTDSIAEIANANIALPMASDSIVKKVQKKLSSSFVPDPTRALWLSLVLPGAGQIYNRKYWKLPIIYGGFIGCTYALLWNQQMYKDYSQAYIDIMDDDPNTASYYKMLPMGYSIEGREEQFKNIFKHKKDFYRKYRDLSIFAFIGVYLISVVDAYVDAQLSSFDISPDLSMKLEPAVFEQRKLTGQSRSVGLQCSFQFKQH